MKISNSLSEKINEHLKLMSILCECYDGGIDIIALSITTAIRVLVHDTKASTSLLTNLGRKTVQYLSANFRETKETVRLGLVPRINKGVMMVQEARQSIGLYATKDTFLLQHRTSGSSGPMSVGTSAYSRILSFT